MPPMPKDLACDIVALKSLVARSAAIVGFTGAGISTESGVPDFRSPDSPWMRNKPIPFEAFRLSREARREAWRRLASDLDPQALELITEEVPLEGVVAKAEELMAGRIRGRVVVAISEPARAGA